MKRIEELNMLYKNSEFIKKIIESIKNDKSLTRIMKKKYQSYEKKIGLWRKKS